MINPSVTGVDDGLAPLTNAKYVPVRPRTAPTARMTTPTNFDTGRLTVCQKRPLVDGFFPPSARGTYLN